MKSFKKLFALVLSVALISSAITAGTIAYLTSTDEDVNVMTLGNVKIEQHEYERATNEDGTYKTATIDDRTSYVLTDFTQGKPLMPAIIPNGGTVDGVTWDYDSVPVRMSQVNSHGGASVFNTPNAQDKFVTVENTGKSDAYVRTLIAFEVGTAKINDDNYPYQPLISYEMRATTKENNVNGKQPWTNGYTGYVEIDGNKYAVYELVYTGAMTSNGWKHENGVLPAGETTYPSLCQVYMASRATNEDVEALDGNKNGTYDILVLSQAVQAEGFADAQAALDTAFGKVEEKAAEWFGGMNTDYIFVYDAQTLKDAMLIKGAKIILADNIVVDDSTPLQWGAYMFVANGREVSINLNGKAITVEENALLKDKALFTTANGGTLNITGNGTVEIKNGKSGIFHAMNKNDQINVYDGTYISNSDNGAKALAIIYTNSGNVDVYGGKFITPDGIECANAEDKQGNRLSIVFHEGTLLKSELYQKGDSTRIQLAEECTLKEVVVNGETWYQVIK